MEDDEIQVNVGGLYSRVYIPQGFAELWKDWVESEHQRAQVEVKKFLKIWAQKGRDLNRPQPKDQEKLAPEEAVQSDPVLIKRFEYYLKFVNDLQPWNIDWNWGDGSDGDPMDTDSDGDPMDTS